MTCPLKPLRTMPRPTSAKLDFCVEKGSELAVDNPARKSKGRAVFQGNDVRDENSNIALIGELSSSPVTI